MPCGDEVSMWYSTVRPFCAHIFSRRFMAINNSAALVAIVSLALVACAKDSPPPNTRARPVKYAVVGTAGTSGSRTVSGSIIARDATQLSFRVGGNLSVLNVKMGDVVEKGQLIGKLDDSDYKVTLSQSQANYQSAKTQRDTAQSSFSRVERLFEAGSSTQAEYEAKKGNLQAAQAQLAASGQAVKQARNQREYAVLRTPFAGVINTVSGKVGERVNPGQAVVIVSRGGELELAVGIPEVIVSAVKVGTKASVKVSALGDDAYPASIREVGFASESSTYPARVALDEPIAALRPGMAASAIFDLGTKTAELSIPTSGVANAEDGSFVYVLQPKSGEEYTITRRPVKIGELMGDAFEITEGVKAGERVAIAGLANLVDGMTVRLLGGDVSDSAPSATPTTPTAPKGAE